MADMYGAIRSNWFAVNDADAFRAWFEADCHFGYEVELWDDELWDDDGQFAFGGYEQYPSAWPRYVEDDETHDYDLEHFAELIRAHLAPDAELRVLAAGNEKLRYVAASHLIVTHETVTFNELCEGN